jgi:hypothetical protein
LVIWAGWTAGPATAGADPASNEAISSGFHMRQA